MVDHFDGDSTVLGFVEGKAGVAVEGRLGESLSQRHKDTEARKARAGFRFVGTPRSSSAHLLSDANGKLGPRPATRYPPHHSDSLDPQRVMEITFEVARLGESLSRNHQETEKNSRPDRRRPRRHQHSNFLR